MISGFVISQSLFKDYCQNGKINILQFYQKRFKRLYPALLVMVICTTVAYVLFGFLWDTNLFIKSSIFSIFAVSNLYFLKQGDNYFAQDLINPLLHTWSLGVEEQFYLIYPLLLAVAFWYLKKQKITPVHIGMMIFFISLGSYVLFSFEVHDTISNFYFPLARFWELGAGCVLFFLSLNTKKLAHSNYLALGASGLIGFVLLFQSSIDNLYIETFFAVAGSAGIIYAGIGTDTGAIKRFLEKRLLVFIGKISYSLYLWHLPVIYFSNLYLTGVSFYVVGITLTVVAALLSYYLVEKPLRYSDLLDRGLPLLVKTSCAVACVVLVVCVWIGVHDSLRFMNTQLNQLQETFSQVNYIESNFSLGERISPDYSINENNVEVNCGEEYLDPDSGLRKVCFKQSERNASVVFLTGDSHAMHFVPMIERSEMVTDLYYRGFPRALLTDADVDFQSEPVFLERVAELKMLDEMYDEVIFVTSMFLNQNEYEVPLIAVNLNTYVKTLKMNVPNIKIVFIAPTPVFEAGPQSCVILEKHCQFDRAASGDMAAEILSVYNSLAEEYSDVYVFNPYETICPNSHCLIYEKENDFLLYRDDDHLSVEGSRSLTAHFNDWFVNNFGFNASKKVSGN